MKAIVEHRSEKRVEVEGLTLCRSMKESLYIPSRIQDLSPSGLFLWAEDAFSTGENIEVVFAPDVKGHDSTKYIAEVVRMHPEMNRDFFGYGCKIKSSETITNISIGQAT